jgi:hypothetical protein
MAAKVTGIYVSTDRIMGVEDLTTIGTTQLWPLGTIIKARDTGSTAYGDVEMMYLKGGTSIAAQSVVSVASDWTVALIAARAKGAVAVSIGAVDATTKYGWFVVRGKAAAKCDSGITDAAPLYIDGTSGRIDDTAVAGDLVIGAVAASTDDTNTCVVNLLTYPSVADFDNA